MSIHYLLYLHGFRSSPLSAKAQLLAQHVRRQHPQVQWCCPQLPPSPKAAAELILRLVRDWPVEQMAVVGSSLGGFYATWLAEQKGCKAVVLNPAVQPARDLAHAIGQHPMWHQPQEPFFFRAEYVDELRALQSAEPLREPRRYFALIAKGDAVLDWREMYARYVDAKGNLQGKLLEGGNHALSDFAQHLPAVLAFLALA